MMLGIVLGTLGIVLAAVVIGLLVDRKVPVLPKPEAPPERAQLPAHTAGEAPATALRVRAEQLAKLRTSQHCPTCRAVMRGEPDDHVRYGDAELLVLRFSCTACEGRRTLYVAAR